MARDVGGNTAHRRAVECRLIEREEEKEEGTMFERFAERYPKKIGKHMACQIWLSIVRPGDGPLILEGLERWIASAEWARDGGKYIPKPERWLAERRWQDEPTPIRTGEVMREPTVIGEELR